MIQQLPLPYLRRFVDAPPYNQILADIAIDTSLGWLISVSTIMETVGRGSCELTYGIYVYDNDLDNGWIEFRREQAKQYIPPNIKGDILKIVHECMKELIKTVSPAVIISRTAEPTLHLVKPSRFQATVSVLDACGYDLKREFQRHDRRWEWTHVRRL